MLDTLTNQIIQELNELPIIKKKAILELIKRDSSSAQKQDTTFQKKWRKELLTTSVWTDSEINEIYKARNFINKWTLQQLY